MTWVLDHGRPGAAQVAAGESRIAQSVLLTITFTCVRAESAGSSLAEIRWPSVVA
ncbi:hypothetical protein [Nonomuraea basaltis]|uniref:hypothetical protein n=1 Tax=Nonomuraea basaltis TaxID=2495887 RepID=UPI0014872C2F|nr:hypothetical protein [Nonomuraea basaltis]